MDSEQEQTTALSEKMTVPSEVEELSGVGGGAVVLTEEEQEAPDIEDEEDYTPLGSSADDPEKARNYKEYKRLVKEINFQNDTIEGIKTEINNINCKPCLDTSERKQLRSLYDCLEQEMQKLRFLIKKAMCLQNFGSRRRYKEINLATTFDEDNMPPLSTTCETMEVQTSKAAAIKCEPCTSWRASGGDTTSDIDKSCSYLDEADMSESEEQKLMKEIYTALHNCTSNQNNKNPSRKKSRPSKDDSIDKLKQRIGTMQHSMNKLKEEICRRDEGLGSPKESCHFRKRKQNLPSKSDQPTCPRLKSQQFQKLKDNYLYLLKEFTKKEKELKDIAQRLKNSCGSGCGSGGVTGAEYNADASEIHLLTNCISDLKEEQIEFKCLMREQSNQLEDYRNKYLTAQQKVEEQCVLIEKLNMNNKRIEKQINMEVKEIRCKFQEKVNELLQFPKLLENEQINVAKLCKERDDLESKLMIVCKELKTHKNKSEARDGGDDCKPQLQKCQQELDQTKKNLEDIKRQRDLFCEKLDTTKEDLDCLRSESAKIIARLKERSELIKQQQQEQINRLENQLAQCRATANLSVSDRECVIREMQGQLNTLSYSFDSAQKQIKTLRNHIAYMSNENCFPNKYRDNN